MNMIDHEYDMQDGARPHLTKEVFNVLHQHFQDRIGLDALKHTGVGLDWSPNSPDINPCDFFLWGYLKDKIYKDAPASLTDLEEAIERQFESISEQTLYPLTRVC